ncbi:hypothetical protein QTP88_002949 [Uroleucon formosanum]
MMWNKIDTIIFTDSLSAINNINNTNNHSDISLYIQNKLYTLQKINNFKIKLFWIPGHSNIIENERDDLAAKTSITSTLSSSNFILYREIQALITVITNKCHLRWHQKCFKRLEMRLMLHILESFLDKFKLKINSKKTKVMVISKVITNTNITLNNEQLQQVKEFCYLGRLITDDNKSTKEIRRRITLAKHAFEKKRTLLTNKHLSISSRKKFVKAYIWSILLYGCESWTIGKYEKDRLEAMEMWMWRKMTRTSWIELKTNEEVLNEINEERTVMNTIMRRTIKLIGHLLRNIEFITIIMEGKIEGKRSRGKSVNPSLKKSSDEWVLPLTKISRGWHLTDMFGYNNKA